MFQHVYVIGNNSGYFLLRGAVDDEAFLAPTLWSWRLYGPSQVRLPASVLTRRNLATWVSRLTARGYVFSSALG